MSNLNNNSKSPNLLLHVITMESMQIPRIAPMLAPNKITIAIPGDIWKL